VRAVITAQKPALVGESRFGLERWVVWALAIVFIFLLGTVGVDLGFSRIRSREKPRPAISPAARPRSDDIPIWSYSCETICGGA